MAQTLTLVLEVNDRGTATLKNFQQTVGRVTGKASAQAEQFTRKMSGGFGALTGKITQTTKELLAFGLGFGAINSAAAAIKAAVGAMTGFETAMANVSTLVDTSKVSMEGLREEILALPPELGTSTELAKALYQTLSAGVEPARAVEFVGQAAKLAKAGLTDTFTAVDVLTTALNAYGLEASEAGRVSDILFKTVEQGKTTVGELAQSVGAAIPLAAQLGIDFADLNAAIATLTAGGLSTSEAVTAMRSAFSNMIQEADKFREAGIDLEKIISEEGLKGALDALREATGGNAEKVREFIPDVRGLTAALALTNEQYETFVEKQQIIQDSLGATETAFQKQTQTLSEHFSTFLASLDRLVQTLSPVVIPALTALVDVLAGLADILTGTIEMIGDFGSLLASLIPGWEGTAEAAETTAGAVQQVSEEHRKLAETAGKAEETVRKSTETAKEGMQAVSLETLQAATSVEAFMEQYRALGDQIESTTAQALSEQAALTTAYETLGIKSTEELQKSADAAVAAFQRIMASGTESEERLQELWVKRLVPQIKAAYGEIPPHLQALNDQMVQNTRQSVDEMLSTYTKAVDAFVATVEEVSAHERAMAEENKKQIEKTTEGIQTLTQETRVWGETAVEAAHKVQGAFEAWGTSIEDLTGQLVEIEQQLFTLPLAIPGIPGELLSRQRDELLEARRIILQKLGALGVSQGEIDRSLAENAAGGRFITGQNEVIVAGQGEMLVPREQAALLRSIFTPDFRLRENAASGRFVTGDPFGGGQGGDALPAFDPFGLSAGSGDRSPRARRSQFAGGLAEINIETIQLAFPNVREITPFEARELARRLGDELEQMVRRGEIRLT